MIRNVERFEEDEEDEVVLETVEVEEEIRPKETRARRAKKDDKRSVSQQDTGGEDELVEETEVVQPRRGLRPRNATGAKTNDDAGESNGSGSEVVGRCSRSGTAKQANAAAGKEAAKKEKPKNGGKKKKGKR
ncbi:hypothetical protein P153DRAFT_368929 [Dothidotthia symphoricarpi CBS 119687]|uniref:Uncharacterized protein n=1 Tax=Dothidotthia symphoricarpi CBS 119687 TaxID=1392245 RepID=A0A6A6A4U1_9PLEO|nr:uncharacterized protein P153DRAFT_368929 [Dothidotthia symphoricarpi CBS 119687]KAF2126909.1 hypothetical protein P153DRAFT_368929 [Dothidotthia symphoricarpi CBS 119687]